MDISLQEVWIRAYTAALTGQMSLSKTTLAADLGAREAADLAVQSFTAKFPPFQSASMEAKK